MPQKLYVAGLSHKLEGASNNSGSNNSYAKAKGSSSSSTPRKMDGKKATKTFTVDPEHVAKRRELVYCHHCYTWGKQQGHSVGAEDATVVVGKGQRHTA